MYINSIKGYTDPICEFKGTVAQDYMYKPENSMAGEAVMSIRIADGKRNL